MFIFSLLRMVSRLFLLLYVDDMLIACKSRKVMQDLKASLSREFEMKDLGPTKKIQGMEIFRDRAQRVLHLSQGGYIQKVLEKFGMKGAKPAELPLTSHFRLSKTMAPQTEVEAQEMEKVSYASGVGSLMYAMVCCEGTRSRVSGLDLQTFSRSYSRRLK